MDQSAILLAMNGDTIDPEGGDRLIIDTNGGALHIEVGLHSIVDNMDGTINVNTWMPQSFAATLIEDFGIYSISIRAHI